ncbi:MAG: LPS-assembly protein LptD [Deltaproteobacteria bacterium]|nr:LPS-assembly protein LptD [Deltaproteobacteria bacterium]
MTRRRALLWRTAFAAAALAVAGRVRGAEQNLLELDKLRTSTGEVTVDAATITYDQSSNVITAHGAVKVTRGDMVLTADTVRVHRATQLAEAEGSVVLTDPQGTVTADAMTLNLVEETGALDTGSVFLNKNHYQLTGSHFEKLPGQSYRIDSGRFTTCLCAGGGAPSWSVRGERISVDLEGYGRVEHGAFEVRGMPILYFPYGLFPVRRDRQSGLLFPRFGYSNRRGFQFEQPLYLAINKSMDATLALDVETAARIGALGEYRYALSEDTAGEVNGAYFNEKIRGASSRDVVNQHIANPNIPVNRWSAGIVHDQWLPGGVHGFADVFRVSDDLFLREINLFTFNPSADVALRTRRFERSQVGVDRVFDRSLLLATGTWYQDFINPDRFVFQVPPRVQGVTVQRFLDDHVALSVAGEGANFARERGFEGQRLDLRPEIEIPWHLSQYAYGSLRGGLRETAYSLSDTSVPQQVNVNPADPGSKPPSILPALDKNATRELFTLNGEAHTQVARVYPFHHLGFDALKHTLEPSLGYLLVPRTDTRQAALPLFDDVDRVNRRSVFTYGVTSRLLGRSVPTTPASRAAAEAAKAPAGPGYDPEGDGTPAGATPSARARAALRQHDDETPTEGPRGTIRELGRFSIFQSYDAVNKGGDFIDETDPKTGEVIPRGATRVSDLGMYLRLAPASFVSFEGRTDYDVNEGRIKGANIYLSLSDPSTFTDDFSIESLRGRSRLSVGYRFVANSALQEVNGGLLLRLTKRYYGAFEARYDNISKKFLEVGGGLRIISDCECWVIDIGLSNRVNPNETQARVLVSLVGLGQVGREPFRRTFGVVAGPARSVLGQ